MKKLSVLTFLLFVFGSAFSQTIIKMKRQGGVSLIPCKVNGLDLELIFDTGASDVSISLNEATSMLNNGKLTKSDIIGTANYVNANGDITEGIVINIKEIEIAGLKMTNVKASVVKNLDAPLLLGQTAISKLGKIQLDLNNNTLAILNGKGTYDYSTYSLTDKLEKHYEDFSIVKIEKKDNKEGMKFSYTVPKKWKEQKVTNNLFKKYIGEEYPYQCLIGLDIGIQTLPSLYDTYEKCQAFIEQVNNMAKKTVSSFKSLSIERTEVSFCKTIKNVTSMEQEGINVLNYQYSIFCGNKRLSFNYKLYSSDPTALKETILDFEDFCNSQISKVNIYNALENAHTCTIQSTAQENQKSISIILNNACNWFKSEGKNELNLVNSFTSSSLSIGISDKHNDLPDLNEVSNAELFELKNSIINSISTPQKILSSDILTLNNKKYIHLIAKSKNNSDYILTECYYYTINNRIITIFSLVKDKDEEYLKMLFKKTQNDLKEILNEIEIIGGKSENPITYFNLGVTKSQSKNFKGAIIDFTTAIELNSQFVEAYYNRGIAKFRLQDYKEALADFNKTIELKSDFADAYLNRGITKIILGTKGSGCIDLDKASALGSTKADSARKTYCK